MNMNATLADALQWSVSNPMQFFILVFIQYAILATLQKRLGRHWVLYPALVVFIIQDWLLNILLSLLFLDPPASTTEVVTKRMQRYKRRYTGGVRLNRLQAFRLQFARTLCRQLNRFDPNHC